MNIGRTIVIQITFSGNCTGIGEVLLSPLPVGRCSALLCSLQDLNPALVGIIRRIVVDDHLRRIFRRHIDSSVGYPAIRGCSRRYGRISLVHDDLIIRRQEDHPGFKGASSAVPARYH